MRYASSIFGKMASDEPIDTAALLAAIVHTTGDAIISVDRREIITSWNRSAERLYGYAAAEAVGQPHRLIIPPDRFAQEADIVRILLEGRPVPSFDTARIRKDGTRVDVWMTASAIRNAAHDIIGISNVGRDILMGNDAYLASRRLAAIVESSDDAIISKDLRSIITAWNPAAERMFGYTREEAIGRSIRMIIPADRQDEEEMVLDRIRRGESIEHYETIRCRKDGSRLPISLTVSPLRNQHGTIIGASKIARDITARKALDEISDEALAASRRLASIVESSDDAIVSKDLNGIITSWNAAAERMFGYTPEEAIGRSIRMIIPPDRQDEETTVLDRIRRGEKIDHFETIRCGKDGTCLPISLTVSPVRNEHGVIIGASKIARDISERKRAEEHANREQARMLFVARMAEALSKSPDDEEMLNAAAELAVPTLADWCAVDIMREDGTIARVAVAHVDPEKSDLARIRHDDATTPYTVQQVLRAGTPAAIYEISDDMIVASARGEQEQIRVLRSLGLTSFIRVPLQAGGHTVGLLTLALGESKRRYADDDLRLAEDIASRLALAVENTRSYRQLERANRLKDEFLATLSHELRTPLNAIVGYARMLRGGMIAGEKVTRAVETIERNSTALAQMVDDLLDVARIVSGKMRLNVQPVELPLVLHEAVQTVTPAADSKRIRIHTVADPHVSPIAGDPDRLRQVVWNLLSNAVKFTPKDGRIHVRLERINSSVEITISDTGIGIAPDFLPHIFERFRQADAGVARQYGGLGLGLALVRNIVEMHGGTVDAFSEGPDRGATFRVRLPIMIVHTRAEDKRRVHPSQESVLPVDQMPDLTGTHVLAVDDEPDALRLLKEILEAAGARVTTASSALVALEKVRSANPDVLVTDLGMPLMDGFELIHRLRQSEDRTVRGIPAAALTAYARSEDRAKALQSGFEMHLAKPIDPVELASAVKALARHHPDQR
jgi:PAS domain S-box-containing protein